MYQEAAADLRHREHERAQAFAKAATLPGADVAIPLAPGAIKLRDLTTAMQRVVAAQAATAKTIAHIEAEPVSLSERIGAVMATLRDRHRVNFRELVAQPSVDGVVTTFLALLELMKSDQIICDQPAPFAEITVMLKEAA